MDHRHDAPGDGDPQLGWPKYPQTDFELHGDIPTQREIDYGDDGGGWEGLGQPQWGLAEWSTIALFAAVGLAVGWLLK